MIKGFINKISKPHAQYLKLVLDERFEKLWPGHAFTINSEHSPLNGVNFTVERIKDVKHRTLYFDKNNNNITDDEDLADILDCDDEDGGVTKYLQASEITEICFPCEATLVCVYWSVENKLEKVELHTDVVFGPWQLIFFPENMEK